MSKRQVFNSIKELAKFITEHPIETARKMPYKVMVGGEEKYVLSGNSDQAIAAVARSQGAQVETVNIHSLIGC